MGKEIYFKETALPKLMAGITKLNNAVQSTLGAKGRTVIIGKGYGYSHITKDGVTVAEAFELHDEVENIAAGILKEAARKTGEVAGDGTTTATVLAHAIIKGAVEAIAAGANPMDIKRGIDEAVAAAVTVIKTLSKDADKPEDFERIATISANNDPAIGALVAKAFAATGTDGVISVEESRSMDTEVSIIQGCQVDAGYVSPYFITNPAKNTCEFINPHIILVGGNVTMMKDLIPIIEKIGNSEPDFFRPVVLVCDSLREEALYTMVTNHVKKQILFCGVTAPSWGNNRRAIMEDLAILTGGSYIAEEKGLKLETAELSHIGGCSKIIIEEGKTVIHEGNGDAHELIQRCDDLKEEIKITTDQKRKEDLKRRLARLQNGVAIIYVGGATQAEVGEKRDRIDDAICATRATAEEGYVAGGGLTHLQCSINLQKDKLSSQVKDISKGIQIVISALEAPIKQMLLNANLDFNYFIDQLRGQPYGFGMNLKEDRFENLLAAGVIDPAKVARVTLENAASVAGVFLTTECVIGNATEPK